MARIPFECFIAHACGSIFFVNDPTDRNPSDWRRAFGDSAWFVETLPNRFPTARSFVFAYQPQNVDISLFDIVQKAAQSLLLQWARLDVDISGNTVDRSTNETRRRESSAHRPVLFVCQSIGGLVVQKVLWGPNTKVILTSHRLYYYLSQKVETLHLFKIHSELYDLPVQ